MARKRRYFQRSGSFPAWLSQAKHGDTCWIEGREQSSIAGDLSRAGCKAETRTYYALHPDSKEVIELVRVRVIREGAAAMSKVLPTARTVRDVLGFVDIGLCRVSINRLSGQADSRFPWKVYGPANEEGEREELEQFARYKTAIRYARAVDRGGSTDGIED